MRAVLTLDVIMDPSAKRAVIGAMTPETSSPPDGSTIALTDSDRGMHLEIVSKDLSSHRASMNSYLGLLQASLGAISSGEGRNNKSK